MDKEILDILKTINGRFDGIEGKFDKLEGRFDKLEGRFDKLENKVNKLEEGQEKIVVRLDNVDKRLDNVDRRLDNLEKGQKEIKAKLDDMTDDMTRELSNIAVKVSGVDAITAKNAHKIADLDMELTKVKAMH